LLTGADRPDNDRHQQNAAQRYEIWNTQGNPGLRPAPADVAENAAIPSGEYDGRQRCVQCRAVLVRPGQRFLQLLDVAGCSMRLLL
jgi:hypothetical protein